MFKKIYIATGVNEKKITDSRKKLKYESNFFLDGTVLLVPVRTIHISLNRVNLQTVSTGTGMS
jgi:hypothetical protein